MEEKKTWFDYLGQVFGLFGLLVTLMCVFCLLFGEAAQGISSMFVLGAEGISIATLGQYLLVSALNVAVRAFFFSDFLIQDKPLAFRTAGMVGTNILIVVCFIFVFGWFPVNMWKPWVMFLFCFCFCFAASTLIVAWKERVENRRMEAALRQLKENGGQRGSRAETGERIGKSGKSKEKE